MSQKWRIAICKKCKGIGEFKSKVCSWCGGYGKYPQIMLKNDKDRDWYYTKEIAQSVIKIGVAKEEK